MSLGLYKLIQALKEICKAKNLYEGNYHHFNYMEIKIFKEEPNESEDNCVVFGKSISNETKDLKRLYKYIIEEIKTYNRRLKMAKEQKNMLREKKCKKF